MFKQSDQIPTNSLYVGLQVTLFISPRHRSIATQLVEEQKEFSLSSLFSDVTQGRLAVTDVSGKFIGLTGCTKSLINCYQSMSRNNPEEQSSPSHRDGRLQSRSFSVHC